jgi:hypothetical protein
VAAMPIARRVRPAAAYARQLKEQKKPVPQGREHSSVGRKPDFAKPTSRPRLSVSMPFRLGRAEVCVGGLGAFGSFALWLRFPMRRV